MARTIPDSIDWAAYARDEDDGRADVRRASEFMEDLVTHLHSPKEVAPGTESPWASVGDSLRFREGEVTLWGGVNGHGKSAVLGEVMLHAISAGDRVCIASMEMRPIATMERLTRQAAATEKPAPEFIRGFGRWTDERLWLYAHVGTVERARMLAVARYCRKELGVHHVVIDSLLKCGIAPDDYAGQKAFVDALCSLARDTGVHIHLVHHIRKGERETDIPDKFDMRGAGEITDLVDNVLIVHRNKAKEALLRKETISNEKREEAEQQADTALICAKQRHHTWEGTVRLWFDAASLQFRDVRAGGARHLDLRSGTWKQGWTR
ncbi:DnaB-like helicase C-terminal domain-containing protein [Burkholderia pseudomallei]|uniref:DnaB-like helicase C-terminal domain-containing protein n=1 Tax=Burkholderia pseudomallei TaxID=28450 RepID=UPI000F099DF9|nr:DnaB-like helicase C-terminal domain-containing protein [Burkholderia pseudomallei]CAJ3815062.1 AAA domain protein [Burkholderia pseudomallei]VBE99746.1 phage related protein [Burkholderia pseudomallei]VBI62824.1 phage related protein [Burkholderia pseudomallei]